MNKSQLLRNLDTSVVEYVNPSLLTGTLTRDEFFTLLKAVTK